MSEMSMIGQRIRELREICGFSAETVAGELGVSLSVYKSYEIDGDDIPISVLYQLSQKYKVDLSELLTGISSRLSDYTIVKRGQGKSTDRYPGYTFTSLAGNFQRKIMEPLLVTVEPSGSDPELVSHPGQEFNMVLDGSIEVLFDDKRLILETGDSIFFDPSHPHGQKARNGVTARFFTVIAE